MTIGQYHNPSWWVIASNPPRLRYASYLSLVSHRRSWRKNQMAYHEENVSNFRLYCTTLYSMLSLAGYNSATSLLFFPSVSLPRLIHLKSVFCQKVKIGKYVSLKKKSMSLHILPQDFS